MPSFSVTLNVRSEFLCQVQLVKEDKSVSNSPEHLNIDLNRLQTYTALIDTGASITSVSAKVAQDLSLIPISRIPINGAGGQVLTNAYIIHLCLPIAVHKNNKNQVVVNRNFFISTRVCEFVGPSHFDVILGMDILKQGVFQYANGIFTFSL